MCRYAQKSEVKIHVSDYRSDPKFLLRLDLVNNADPNDLTRSASHHLEADYSGMKLLQSELGRAVEEFNSTHCQRINRYIA
eukprot:gene22772-28934_t